jgi:hypothetical protein
MQRTEELNLFLRSISKSNVRMRQRRVNRFEKGTLKMIALSIDGGILAVTGRLRNEQDRKIQTLIFNKSVNQYGIKVWNLRKAKDWIAKYKKSIIKSVNPEKIANRIIIMKAIKFAEQQMIKKLPKIITDTLRGGKKLNE